MIEKSGVLLLIPRDKEFSCKVILLAIGWFFDWGVFYGFTGRLRFTFILR